MTASLILGKIIVFLFLAVGMYFVIKGVREYEIANKIRNKVDELERQRFLEIEQKSFMQKYLAKMDERLTQAGIKKFLPRATVEIYFLFNALEFTLIFCLAGNGLLIPLGIAGLAVYLNKLILDILRFRNKRITEKHLLELLNLISDYSLSESEITMILYRCGQMMPNPLKEVLTKCHISARSTGDTEQALYELRRSIDHFLFQEIILFQLSKCSEDDADIYAEVDRETFTKWRVDDNHRDYLVKVNKEMGYKVMSYHEAELELDDPNGEDVLVDESCNVEEEVLKKIEIDKLYDAMQKLSESDQELIRVFFFSEKQMTFREYAAITKIPSQTINFRTLRACKRLKKLMEN